MKLTLRRQLTQFGHVLQSALFPALEEELGELGEPAKRLIATLEMIPLARFVPSARGWMGRPSKDRLAIASAFVAKAVYGFSLTRQLLDALQWDAQLRRILRLARWLASAERVDILACVRRVRANGVGPVCA